MTLEQWDRDVRPVLQGLRWNSQMLASRARSLKSRPDWQTMADDMMQQAEDELSAALRKVREARDAYESVPVAAE